jgi:hypothetical protein
MATLGSRLFFLQLHTKPKSHSQLIAQNRGTSRQEKERICREATDSLLRTLWTTSPSGVAWSKDNDPDDCLLVIARCAELLAALRGAIQVWDDGDGLKHNSPTIEQADRINALLCNLARGHALLCGRRRIEKDDLAPVLEITFDSAPMIRAKVFRALLQNDGTLTSGEVERLLNCSKGTALKEMEKLSILGVADKEEITLESGQYGHDLTLVVRFEWFMSDQCKSLQW